MTDRIRRTAIAEFSCNECLARTTAIIETLCPEPDISEEELKEHAEDSRYGLCNECYWKRINEGK